MDSRIRDTAAIHRIQWRYGGYRDTAIRFFPLGIPRNSVQFRAIPELEEPIPDPESLGILELQEPALESNSANCIEPESLGIPRNF